MKLLPFNSKNFDDLIEWIPDARALLIWSGPEYTWPLDCGQLHRNLQKTLSGPKKGVMLSLWSETTLNTLLGHGEIMNIDTEKKTAHLGRIIVSPQYRRKKIGQSLVERLCEYAFEKFKLDQLTLGVFQFNEQAIKCYQKVGFKVVKTRPIYRSFESETWELYTMKLERSHFKKKQYT